MLCVLCVPSGAPTLIPSPTALLGLLDGSAVSGSDLILLCTTRTCLVPDYVQSLRRVRGRLMPRSPMMTKPPRVLTHSPILCSYCALCFCDPDELCLMLFSWSRIVRLRLRLRQPPRSLSIDFDIGNLFAVGSQLGASPIGIRALYQTTGPLGLLLRFRRNLSWSVLFAFHVR